MIWLMAKKVGVARWASRQQEMAGATAFEVVAGNLDNVHVRVGGVPGKPVRVFQGSCHVGCPLGEG